ncbi:MAG TPA: deoxyribose-phosphate aldolase [Gemmatimonadales bacterium]|jgi:deoxyribose-phosphate aldolase
MAEEYPVRGRNAGVAFDVDWVHGLEVTPSAVARRAAQIRRRRQATAWGVDGLLRVVACTDLTSLSGDETDRAVQQLCGTARQPIRADLLETTGSSVSGLRVAAVCVHARFVSTACNALVGTGIPVAAAAGFPTRGMPMPPHTEEIRAAVRAGAGEVDAVITRAHVLAGDWLTLYGEVRSFRDACGPARLKTILAAGELGPLHNVARASWVCMMAGADFIKTSTGKEKVNATLSAGLVMAQAIRQCHALTGFGVGLKPAGGIRRAAQAIDWLLLVEEELGAAWQSPARFRVGASALLADVERQIARIAQGAHSAGPRRPEA